MADKIEYNIKQSEFPARSRSKRRREAGILYTGSSSFNGGWTGEGSIGVTDHKQLSGVMSTAEEYTYTARDLHLTAEDADKIKELDKLDEKYLRKDRDDTAHGIISFDKEIRNTSSRWNITSEGDITANSAKIKTDITLNGAVTSKEWQINANGYASLVAANVDRDVVIGGTTYTKGFNDDIVTGGGWQITNSGKAVLDGAEVRQDIFIGGRFGSKAFQSGFTGSGVDIDIPTASATFDHLTVRKSMKVYELVYSQIYGLGGSVIISDLNKILTVERNTGFFRCTIDTMEGTMRMNLRKGDVVRMQHSSGINIKYFYGEIINFTPDYFDLRIIDGDDVPEPGDVVFRFGNKTDKNRQGLLYLTSSDDQAPYLDILDGMTDSSMQDKVKVRLGNLSGIRTKSGKQLNTYGIYAQGAVFEDTDIYLEDGSTVSQKFELMNGKLLSEMEKIKNDMSLEPGNILKNSSFNTNLNYWSALNDVSFITEDDDTFLWLDGHYYSEKRAVADIYPDGNKNVLRLRNISITQSNDVMNIKRDEEEEKEVAEGKEREKKNYAFVFLAKVITPGTLTAGFAGQELYLEKYLEAFDKYEVISHVAKWATEGDFRISFTGEILIYGVSLVNDGWADYRTQLKQTAKTISGVSERVDLINDTIDTAGWITESQGNHWWVKEVDLKSGNVLQSLVTQIKEGIIINGKQIDLSGTVTIKSFDESLGKKMNIIDAMGKDDELAPSEKVELKKQWKLIQAEYNAIYERARQATNTNYNQVVKDNTGALASYYNTLNTYIQQVTANQDDITAIDGAELTAKFANYHGAYNLLDDAIYEYDAHISSQQLAQDLGYTEQEYLALLRKTSGRRTLIKEGFIDTEMIKANSILAKHIDVDNLEAKKLAAEVGYVGPFYIGRKIYESKWYRGGSMNRPNLSATDDIEYNDNGSSIFRKKKIDLGGTAIIMESTDQYGGKPEGKWGTGEVKIGPNSVTFDGEIRAGNNVLVTAPFDASILIRSKNMYRPVDFGMVVELYNQRVNELTTTAPQYNEEFGKAVFFLGRKRIYHAEGDWFRSIELGSHAFQQETWNHSTYIRMDNMMTEHCELPKYNKDSGVREGTFKIGVEKKDAQEKVHAPKVMMWDPMTGYIFASDITITHLKTMRNRLNI